MGLKCLKGPNCDQLTILKTYGDTGPSSPKIYGIFIMFTEDEGNIIYDFAGIADNMLNAKNMIDNFSKQYVNIKPVDQRVNQDNCFTYIGNRIDLKACSNQGFGSCNGFVIEDLTYNKICTSY